MLVFINILLGKPLLQQPLLNPLDPLGLTTFQSQSTPASSSTKPKSLSHGSHMSKPSFSPLNVVSALQTPPPVAIPSKTIDVQLPSPTTLKTIPQESAEATETAVPTQLSSPATCNSTATLYLSCVESFMSNQNTGKFDDASCSHCSSEYTTMTNLCNDADYKNNRLLFYSFMNCHQENRKYCGNSMNSFSCDSCGKFLSTKLVDYGILDQMADKGTDGVDINKAQYQHCAGKGDLSAKSIASSLHNVNVVLFVLFIL